MEWMTWSRCDWAAWQWEHPWTFAILPVILAVFLLVQKIKNR